MLVSSYRILQSLQFQILSQNHQLCLGILGNNSNAPQLLRHPKRQTINFKIGASSGLLQRLLLTTHQFQSFLHTGSLLAVYSTVILHRLRIIAFTFRISLVYSIIGHLICILRCYCLSRFFAYYTTLPSTSCILHQFRSSMSTKLQSHSNRNFSPSH